MAKTFDALAFTKAKRVIFDRFVAAVGRIQSIPAWEAKEGRNCFKSFLPPAYDVWGFTMGGSGDVSQTWNTTPPWELQMNGDIEGQFRTEDAADEVGMKLLSALDMRWIDDDGQAVVQAQPHRVQSCRLRAGGTLDVFLGRKPIANEGVKANLSSKADPVLLWEVHIGLIVTFNTWTGV